MKRAILLLAVAVVLSLGCAEGQKPNPLPRANDSKQHLPPTMPGKQRDQAILWDGLPVKSQP
jgi:hypothetical protein